MATTAIRIARHLLQVHEGGNWTEMDITSVLEDVRLEEAITPAPASPNTIAALLHHISCWNRVITQRIKGILPTIPEDNGFHYPTLHTADDWAALRADNIASAQELAEAMRNVPEGRLDTPILPDHSSVYTNLQGQVEHIHYHLGQMVYIKKWLREGKD